MPVGLLCGMGHALLLSSYTSLIQCPISYAYVLAWDAPTKLPSRLPQLKQSEH
jgi:hypothetical protein